MKKQEFEELLESVKEGGRILKRGAEALASVRLFHAREGNSPKAWEVAGRICADDTSAGRNGPELGAGTPPPAWPCRRAPHARGIAAEKIVAGAATVITNIRHIQLPGEVESFREFW